MGSTKDFDVGKLPEDDRKLTNEQTFDSALAAMVTKLERYVIPLVNEVFGKQYSENTRVEIRNNKHVIRQPDGSLKKRETDAYVELSEAEKQGHPAARYYHFECETWYDRSIVLRIAEYASVIAEENAEEQRDGVILNYPDSAVIFLRPGKKIPKAMKITHRLPNGAEVSYEVPALQITDYGVDEIFEKKLLILLPFYLFRFVDEFERMEKEADRRKEMEEALGEISRRLEKLAEVREITVYQQRTILDLLLRVSDRLTVGYKELRKGVDDIMTGYVLRTEADDILDRGIAQGIERGRAEGRAEDQREMSGLINYLLTNNRSGDALRATTDRDYLNELLSQFRQGLLPARQ